MDIQKLKEAEASFLNRYPGGFQHPDILVIAKKHKMEAMVSTAQQAFSKTAFSNEESVVDALVKLTTRASMVSVFEKPKFRDYVYGLSLPDKSRLVHALYERLHGDPEKGFIAFCDLLKQGKLAKWSLVTIIPAYYAPSDEVFVKPTTAKDVIAHLSLSPLRYDATPTWDFYVSYRETIKVLKTHVDPVLSPSNAAFSGFLMMSLGG